MCKPKGINRKKLVPFVLPITFTHFWEKVWTGSRCEVSVKSSALKFNPIHAKLEKTQKIN